MTQHEVVSQTIQGTWSVHAPDQRPVDGTAVHYYPQSHKWRCEVHGQRCEHIQRVLAYLAWRGKLVVQPAGN